MGEPRALTQPSQGLGDGLQEESAVSLSRERASGPLAPAAAAAATEDVPPNSGPKIAEKQPRNVGDLLLARGKLEPAALARAERAQAETGERLDRVLTRLGLVGERDMAEALAALLGLPLTARDDYPALPLAEETLAAKFLKDSQVLPIALEEDGKERGVTLAMADPLDDFAAEAVGLRLGLPVARAVATVAELEDALERLYGGGRGSLEQIAATAETAEEEGTEADVARLRDQASEAPVIRIVNLLIAKAVEARASDIHIEPFEASLRVRTRVDGVLREVEAPPARLRAAVISRIKIMAKLNIAEHRLPQDGRLKIVVRGKEIDLRVSTLPSLHGEGAVLRILDRQGVVLDFDALGFDAETKATLRALLQKPNGILLVTGPTGSGKTTTLYTALKELNAPEKKILTVEDPVEYQLDGVNQIQVRPKIGLTFAHVLRAILRQDPDIVMIGEIRDLETAQIAVQAALTGHLVLATVHTNTAAATITRLLDMGVEDYLLTSTLVGILAQRLVRRLCPHCREAHDALPELAQQIDPSGAPVTLYQPQGCPQCNGSGYHGRAGILEILPMGDEIRRLVLRHAESRELHKAAVAGGMRSMYQDGLAKARAGVTSFEEVARVTSLAGD
ncbi:type II secretion system ATPase GspE [Pelagibius sp. CAU 1746]|uniref:type II secretion system ATPase GspE n=1 Tax=Pelagibius sp. CAU 1746 TaxID=3140370 RepID=UPI00325B2179